MTVDIHRKSPKGNPAEVENRYTVFVDPNDGTAAIIREFAKKGSARSYYNKEIRKGHGAQLMDRFGPTRLRVRLGEFADQGKTLPPDRLFEVRWLDRSTGTVSRRPFTRRGHAIDFMYDDLPSSYEWDKAVGYYEDGTLYLGWEVRA